MGIERMVRELQMAFVSAQINPSPALQVVNTAFVGSDFMAGSRIDFTSFSHQRLYRDAHESDQNELSYYVDDDPHDPGTEGADPARATAHRRRPARRAARRRC